MEASYEGGQGLEGAVAPYMEWMDGCLYLNTVLDYLSSLFSVCVETMQVAIPGFYC